jgi:hypothetical protein
MPVDPTDGRTWARLQPRWGPATWAPEPAREAAEERRQRAAEGRATWAAWLAVLGALALGFAALGPWLGLLTPGTAATSQALCVQTARADTVVFKAQPAVFASGLRPGDRVTLAVKFGRAVAVVVSLPPPDTTAVRGVVASLSPSTGQIAVTVAGNGAPAAGGTGRCP